MNFLHWVGVIISLIGVMFLTYKKVLGFYILLVSNVILISIDFYLGNYPEFALFIGYFIVNLLGAYCWRTYK